VVSGCGIIGDGGNGCCSCCDWTGSSNPKVSSKPAPKPIKSSTSSPAGNSELIEKLLNDLIPELAFCGIDIEPFSDCLEAAGEEIVVD
jgi:hypothetical protein